MSLSPRLFVQLSEIYWSKNVIAASPYLKINAVPSEVVASRDVRYCMFHREHSKTGTRWNTAVLQLRLFAHDWSYVMCELPPSKPFDGVPAVDYFADPLSDRFAIGSSLPAKNRQLTS